jgi:beta-lactamase regulating signal transducer with metallopeptidase domain
MSEVVLIVGGSALLSVVAKSTLIAAGGLAGAWMARRARASVRHLILASSLTALVVLPLLGALLPPKAIVVSDARPLPRAAEVPPPSGAAIVRIAAAPAGNDGGRPPAAVGFLEAAIAGWLAIAIAVAASGAAGIARLSRICRRARPWPEVCSRFDAEVLLSDEVAGPLTCGLLRPVILLPTDARDWSYSELHRALVHELEHIRRRDWATQLMARASCAIHWFNPLVWLISSQLTLDAERACDDAVLLVADGADYAEQLVVLARRWSTSPPVSTLAMAARSDLAARVSALLNAGQRRGRAGGARIAATLVLVVALVSAMAPLRAVRAAAPPPLRPGQSHIFVQWPGAGAHGPREILAATEPITLDLSDVSLPALLHSLVTNGSTDGQHTPRRALGWTAWPDSYQPPAAVRRLNLVIHAGVQKQISIKASARPWNELFEKLLADNGLGLILDDDLLLIARVEDLPAFDQLRNRVYGGTRINMNFLNAPLRDGQIPKQDFSVLGLLGQVTKLRLLPEPDTRGPVTLRIMERPAFEVLALVLAANDLSATSTNEKDTFRVGARSGEAVDFAALFPPVATN